MQQKQWPESEASSSSEKSLDRNVFQAVSSKFFAVEMTQQTPKNLYLFNFFELRELVFHIFNSAIVIIREQFPWQFFHTFSEMGFKRNDATKVTWSLRDSLAADFFSE